VGDTAGRSCGVTPQGKLDELVAYLFEYLLPKYSLAEAQLVQKKLQKYMEIFW
jgi:hypothetical protein